MSEPSRRLGIFLVLAGLCTAQGTVSTDSSGARLLSPLPPAGVHPRVYFSPEDMPEVRGRYLHTQIGQIMQGISAQQFKSMQDGLRSFAALDLTDPTLEQIATYVKSDEGRNIRWGLLSLDAVLREDVMQQTLMAQVITNYARLILASRDKVLSGQIKAGTAQPFNKIHALWTKNNFDVGVSWTLGAAGFSVSYDLLYNHMTPGQRKTVRQAIATATQGRRSWGMGVPRGRAASNHYGYHGDLAVMLSAIEGEEGYDRETCDNIKQVLLDYFEVGFTPKGACHEDLYGPNLGLRAGSRGLLALARRGHNIFTTDRYKNFMRYIAREFEPFRTGVFVGGASGGPGLPYPTSLIIARYMRPHDPVANYNWRYFMGEDYRRSLRWQGWFDFALFGMDWTGDTLTLADAGLELSEFYPRRGKLIARSDWSETALCWHLDARPDAFQIGHDTVDRGHFILSALGRAWAVRGSWHHFRSSRDHSLVHIDGLAQAWKAPSVRFLRYEDAGGAVLGVADLKYAYDWQWSPPWPDKNKVFGPPWEPERSDPRDLGWPDDPNWLPHSLYDEPGIGYIGSWMWRKVYRPVQKAFRSTVMRRGEHPYVLVVDDVRQDNAEHTYTWHMQVATDLNVIDRRGRDMILGDETDRRLLVRVLDPQAKKNVTLEMESYQVAEDRGGTPVMGQRVLVTTTAVEPAFKVMLWPCHSREDLPATTWQQSGTHLSVHYEGVTDHYRFRPHADGRTRLRLQRGHQVILTEDQR